MNAEIISSTIQGNDACDRVADLAKDPRFHSQSADGQRREIAIDDRNALVTGLLNDAASAISTAFGIEEGSLGGDPSDPGFGSTSDEEYERAHFLFGEASHPMHDELWHDFVSIELHSGDGVFAELLNSIMNPFSLLYHLNDIFAFWHYWKALRATQGLYDRLRGMVSPEAYGRWLNWRRKQRDRSRDVASGGSSTQQY